MEDILGKYTLDDVDRLTHLLKNNICDKIPHEAKKYKKLIKILCKHKKKYKKYLKHKHLPETLDNTSFKPSVLQSFEKLVINIHTFLSNRDNSHLFNDLFAGMPINEYNIKFINKAISFAIYNFNNDPILYGKTSLLVNMIYLIDDIANATYKYCGCNMSLYEYKNQPIRVFGDVINKYPDIFMRPRYEYNNISEITKVNQYINDYFGHKYFFNPASLQLSSF